MLVLFVLLLIGVALIEGNKFVEIGEKVYEESAVSPFLQEVVNGELGMLGRFEQVHPE
jgi:hypothetical protein